MDSPSLRREAGAAIGLFGPGGAETPPLSGKGGLFSGKGGLFSGKGDLLL
jgi:hypothetical protein